MKTQGSRYAGKMKKKEDENISTNINWNENE